MLASRSWTIANDDPDRLLAIRRSHHPASIFRANVRKKLAPRLHGGGPFVVSGPLRFATWLDEAMAIGIRGRRRAPPDARDRAGPPCTPALIGEAGGASPTACRATYAARQLVQLARLDHEIYFSISL